MESRHSALALGEADPSPQAECRSDGRDCPISADRPVAGGIYALVALGFYIMWEATKAANFTHGDVYMFGAVVTVVLVERGLPLLIAAPVAIAAATVDRRLDRAAAGASVQQGAECDRLDADHDRGRHHDREPGDHHLWSARTAAAFAARRPADPLRRRRHLPAGNAAADCRRRGDVRAGSLLPAHDRSAARCAPSRSTAPPPA